jgi:hypothetical protein
VAGIVAAPRLGAALELGLIENLYPFDSSADFGVHAGLRYRF